MLQISKFGNDHSTLEGSEVMFEPLNLPEQGVYFARTLSRNQCRVNIVNVSSLIFVTS